MEDHIDYHVKHYGGEQVYLCHSALSLEWTPKVAASTFHHREVVPINFHIINQIFINLCDPNPLKFLF